MLKASSLVCGMVFTIHQCFAFLFLENLKDAQSSLTITHMVTHSTQPGRQRPGKSSPEMQGWAPGSARPSPLPDLQTKSAPRPVLPEGEWINLLSATGKRRKGFVPPLRGPLYWAHLPPSEIRCRMWASGKAANTKCNLGEDSWRSWITPKGHPERCLRGMMAFGASCHFGRWCLYIPATRTAAGCCTPGQGERGGGIFLPFVSASPRPARPQLWCYAVFNIPGKVHIAHLRMKQLVLHSISLLRGTLKWQAIKRKMDFKVKNQHHGDYLGCSPQLRQIWGLCCWSWTRAAVGFPAKITAPSSSTSHSRNSHRNPCAPFFPLKYEHTITALKHSN